MGVSEAHHGPRAPREFRRVGQARQSGQSPRPASANQPLPARKKSASIDPASIEQIRREWLPEMSALGTVLMVVNDGWVFHVCSGGATPASLFPVI